MRVVPYYDGVNDISNYRLDVLYGVKVVDNRLAVRMAAVRPHARQSGAVTN